MRAKRPPAMVATAEVFQPRAEEHDDARVWISRRALVAGVIGLGFALVVLGSVRPAQFGFLLVLGGAAVVAILLGLRSPVLATMYLLASTLFRLAIPSGTFPVDPFLPAFAGVVCSTWLWVLMPARRATARFGPIEAAMVLYVAWNFASMATPHVYPAGPIIGSQPYSLLRFILIGTVMPLAMFVVGWIVFRTESDVRRLLWALIAAGAYSAFVSIGQFSFPSLVWPRFIVEDVSWIGRANGVFQQPVVNGLVLIVGYVSAVLVASHRSEPRGLRVAAAAVAAGSVYGIYLTHTRAAWLSFAVVVIIGAVTAKGFRTGYVVTAAAMVLGVVISWSTFTSSDREAGGVGSPSEVEDRLNSLATSVWAIKEHPLFGWGVGRFYAINTYHHQQWSPEIPWERGFAISSHFDVVGIFTELGLVGVVLWVSIIAMVVTQVNRSRRQLPERGMCNRPFARTALMCLVALITTGLTVDLRFFDFPNIIVWLIAGAAIGRGQRAQELHLMGGEDVPRLDNRSGHVNR